MLWLCGLWLGRRPPYPASLGVAGCRPVEEAALDGLLLVKYPGPRSLFGFSIGDWVLKRGVRKGRPSASSWGELVRRGSFPRFRGIDVGELWLSMDPSMMVDLRRFREAWLGWVRAVEAGGGRGDPDEEGV